MFRLDTRYICLIVYADMIHGLYAFSTPHVSYNKIRYMQTPIHGDLCQLLSSQVQSQAIQPDDPD